MKRAFTLIELLVVIAIIAVLAGIGYPVVQRVVHNARSANCTGHLRQLGAALNAWLVEHEMRMPELRAGRADKSEELPVIDNTLDRYVKEPAMFACPADLHGIAERTGTSYYWNVTLNGQPLAALNFLNLTEEHSRIPILADKEGWHPYEQNKVNLLYADGHVTKDLTFFTEK